MKLCRFTLSHDPDHVRSGIFYDNRVYETDGENAIGLHDLGKVRLLAPLGQPPSWRAFDLAHAGGETRLIFRYRNPIALTDPDAEIDAPDGAKDLELELRLAIVVSDRGDKIDPDEAASFVLGTTLMLSFVAADTADDEALLGLPDTASHDLPTLIGPFLVTPDEIEALGATFRVELGVNGHAQARVEAGFTAPLGELLASASRTLPVAPGDLVALPAFDLPRLTATHLGRALRPGDQVLATVDGLGALSARIG